MLCRCNENTSYTRIPMKEPFITSQLYLNYRNAFRKFSAFSCMYKIKIKLHFCGYCLPRISSHSKICASIKYNLWSENKNREYYSTTRLTNNIFVYLVIWFGDLILSNWRSYTNPKFNNLLKINSVISIVNKQQNNYGINIFDA